MKKRQIFIELTSLLDVIMIMLFMILMQARNTAAVAVKETDEIRASVEILQQEADAARLESDAAKAEAAKAAAEAEAVRSERETERAEAEAALAEASEAVMSAEARYAELRDGYNLLERQLITDNLVLDNSLVVTVSVDDASSIRLEATGRQPVIIPYDWDNETYAVNSLRMEASEIIRQTENTTVFFVFQYDRNKIYEREYDLICRTVSDLKHSATETGKWMNYIETDISAIIG